MALPSTRPEYISRITQRVRNDDLAPSTIQLTVGEIDDIVDHALEIYSNDKPRIFIESIDGDATQFEFVLGTELTNWIDHVSVVMEVRITDDDATQRVEQILPDGVYEVRLNVAGVPVLRLLNHTPAATENIEVVFNLLHDIESNSTTVPQNDRYAVLNLCTALACQEIATNAMITEDSNVDADSLDLESASDKWEGRAEKWWKKYQMHVKSVMGEPIKAAGTTLPWFSASQATGRRRLTHQYHMRGQRSRY